MEQNLSVADYLVIGITLAISAAIGLFFRFTGGKQKTTKEFLMAGKNMSILPVAFSLMATYMSAIALLGVPAETYLYGSQMMMWGLGVVIGGIISAYLYVPVYFDMDAATAYESYMELSSVLKSSEGSGKTSYYLEKRFGKLTRLTASFLFCVQMVFYMAVVLYAPSLALNAVTNISTWSSVVTIAVVCTFYCTVGGLKAVLWTDVFQAGLMFLTVFSIIAKGSADAGGFLKSLSEADEGGRIVLFETAPDLTTRYTLWNVIAGGAYYSLSTFAVNQAQIQRMLSIRSLRKSQTALFISIPLIVIFYASCCLDGVMIYSRYRDCDPILSSRNGTLKKVDQILPYAVVSMFSEWPGLTGLCISGVFGAALSTISSAVNSLTAVTMEDFIRPHCACKRLGEYWTTFMAKMIAVGFGAVCLLFTFVVSNFRGVFEACTVLFGMIAAPVLGVFSLGLFTTTGNEQGALLGLLSGMIVNAWLGFGSARARIKVPTLPRTVEGCTFLSNSTIQLITSENKEAFSSDFAMEQNKDIFIGYRISYMWLPIFGAITAFVIGYFASWIFGCFQTQKPVNSSLISPFLRKRYFGCEKKMLGKAKSSRQQDNELAILSATLIPPECHIEPPALFGKPED